MLRRHLLKFLAAVFCLSQLTLAVSAQTPTGSYSDVPIESPHYEAIEYLTDMGVTTGVGGGRFAPDNTISFDEFIVMLMKTLQPEAVAEEYSGNHWCRQALWAAIHSGVLNGPESERYQKNGITRLEAWHLICRASNFNPYPAWCFTQQAPVFDIDADLKYAMVSTGLYAELPDVNQCMTRGETATLLYRIATEDYIHQQVPDLAVKVNMQMLSPTCWRMRNKRIYLECDRASTVLHEFGHYMEYDTKSDLKVDKVFQQEHEHAKILLEDYAQTNAREYFACAIEEYFLNEEERHIFEQELPLTYALVEDILLNYA